MKKLLLILAALTASYVVNASYLYWTIDNTVSLEDKNGKTSYDYTFVDYNEAEYAGKTSEFSFVNIVGTDASGKALTVGTVGADGSYTSLGTSTISAPGTYVIDLGDFESGGSFYIEYLAYNSSSYKTSQVGVTKGDNITYTNIENYLVEFDGTGLTPISTVNTATTWHGGKAINTPEPTSGMLVLLGMAMLGLKRRKLNKVA